MDMMVTQNPIKCTPVKILFFTFLSLCANAQVLKPSELLCEHVVNPLGIDTPAPRLGWVLTGDGNNLTQSAYEIIVSDNRTDITQGKGALWSTGKVASAEQIVIDYQGQPLKAFTRYYWSVRVYDQNDRASAWSEPAWFETAMLAATDWKAQWISDGSRVPDKDEDQYKADPMPLFRKAINATKAVASARLYISGVGYYEAYLNGQKIGDHVLDPGWTTYRKAVLYVTHDISAQIKKGNNTIGIMLGNGWWNPLPFKIFGRWDLRNYQQTGRPCVKAEVHLTYADGTTTIVASDGSWQTAPGPVVRNNVYLGEHYDARLEVKGWDAGATKGSWKNASLAEGPSGVLMAQMQPPIRVTKVVKAVSIKEHKPGVFIADLGQNFAGVARIRVKGPKGARVTLRYGEDLFTDGSLNVMTTVATQIKKGGIKAGPGAPETAWQEDSYTLKGEGTETWSPRFTFHGFRYVEITGWPGKPAVNDIEGLRMNTDLTTAGTFACSNEMFTKLHDVIQWTFLSNVFSVQSDCPGREKMGYGADMVVSANAFIYNYDMANFYRKTVLDFANEQQPDGGITEIAPFTGIADRGYGGDSGPMGWQLGYAFLQKQLYDFYGDKQVISENYGAIQKQIAFLRSKAVDGLFHWDISDHESLDPRPEAFSASVFYYHHALLAAEFAGILDKSEDSVAYGKLAEGIRRAIVSKYLVPKTGRFDLATQAAQTFALWYKLSPEEKLSYQVLKDEINRHDGHLSSGIFGVKMMFDVLREHNDSETAYRIANQRDYPGWGYMLSRGATTLWESWYFSETVHSRNHPMFGSIDEWFYRSLLGINPTSAGFKTFVIKPQPAGDLTWARGSYKSVRGTISGDWKITGGQFQLNVTIPANTKATVYIPTKNTSSVSEGQKAVANNPNIKHLADEQGYAVLEVGSGSYYFTAER